MKVSTICLFSCSISLYGQATAFAPQSLNHSPLPSRHHSITSSSSSLNAVENAVSSAPDILLAAGAALTTVGAAAAAALGKLPSFGGSADQSSAVNGNAIGEEATPEIIDVTITYDAASRLAFESYPENNSVDYAQFKMLYESQMVAEVKAKVQERKVKEMQLVLDELEKDATKIRVQIKELFRPKTTVDGEKAVNESASGTSVDLSIDYDAAAKLAYEASGKSTEFDTFRERYVEETVAMVSAKKAERDASN